MSRETFVIAEPRAGTDWLTKAASGQVVTASERNAFVVQAAAAMDALANPGAIVTPSGLRVDTVSYHGDVTAWAGRQVPFVGSQNPPAAWLAKRGPSAGAMTWADVLLPTNDERRSLWLATAGLMKTLHGTGVEVGSRALPRTAGDAADAAAVVVVAVGPVAALGVWLFARDREISIRESEETARQANELAAAQAAWLQRVQWSAAHPGEPMPPPSPAETRVLQRPPEGGRSPADRMGDSFLDALAREAKDMLVAGIGLFAALTVLPPVLSNLADRATRGPALGGARA